MDLKTNHIYIHIYIYISLEEVYGIVLWALRMARFLWWPTGKNQFSSRIKVPPLMTFCRTLHLRARPFCVIRRALTIYFRRKDKHSAIFLSVRIRHYLAYPRSISRLNRASASGAPAAHFTTVILFY